MTYIGSGLGAQLMMKQETVPGTAVAPDHSYDFESETLGAKKKVVQVQTLRAGNMFDRAAGRFVTQRAAAGDINMVFPTKQAGLLLANMLGSFATTPTQIASTTAYSQVHLPGSTQGKALTVQIGKPPTTGSAAEPFTYPGSKITDWELSFAQSDILKLKLTLDAFDELTTATTPASPALGSWTPPTYSYFSFTGGSLLAGGTVSTTSGVTSVTGGTAVATALGGKITGKTGVKIDNYFLGNGTTKTEQNQNAFRSVTGSVDVEFSSRAALYDAYRSDTSFALELKFVSPLNAGVGNPFSLDIILPVCFWEDGASPQVAGPDVLKMSVPFTTVIDDAGDPEIQITYVSTDTSI